MGQLERLAAAANINRAIDLKIKNLPPNIAEVTRQQNAKNLMSELDFVREDAKLTFAKLNEKKLTGMLGQLAYFRRVSKSAREHQVANCGEYAGYVFWKLYKSSTLPISYIAVDNVRTYQNHAFVLIGSADKGEQDMSNWKGTDYVISDPWLPHLIRQVSTAPLGLNENAGAFTPETYIDLTKDWFKDGTKVKSLFGQATLLEQEVPKLTDKL